MSLRTTGLILAAVGILMLGSGALVLTNAQAGFFGPLMVGCALVVIASGITLHLRGRRTNS